MIKYLIALFICVFKGHDFMRMREYYNGIETETKKMCHRCRYVTDI